ncbi:MAG: energy transducer TonB [Acidobacteriia bacterium]|nr:energy transducer TonB [Terriglobia bacterium]
MAYRFRPVSFVASISVHAAAILSLGLIPRYQDDPQSRRPVYDELIRPEERKIVWYNYRKPLPDVTAARRVGTFPKPRGRELSKDAIIATAPHAKSANQIIWRPVPKLEIHQDLPAPNLVLRSATAIPAPQPPPPRELRKFVQPNLEGVHAEQPNVSLLTPNGDVNLAQQNTTRLEMPMPRKEFVPPPPSSRASRLTLPVEVGDIAVPDASIAGTTGARMALPEGLGAPSFSRGAPPPSNAPPGTETTAGNGKADIAVASLHPGNGPVPDGARPGAFSKAPIVGDPASGEVSGGLRVPNLSIREDRSKPVDAPRVTPNRKQVLYADKIRNIPVSTLSVPLRPASRTIPHAIDARFQGRNVYTMVIPIENFAPYSGDWILWFAEQQAKPGDTPLVRAPVPLRKFESVEPVLPGAHTELRVQVTARIKRDGKIEGAALLRSQSPGIEQAVLQDLAEWEFKPATRDGSPVDVDAVFEIPYSLPPQLAKSAQP